MLVVIPGGVQLQSADVPGLVVEPEFLHNHTHRRVYHYIRNADLLSSYNLRRAFLYHYYKYPYLPFEEIIKDVITLYYNRMKKLRSNKILSLENKQCNLLSQQLEKECDYRIRTFLSYSLPDAIIHFNMLPNISTIDLISKF